MPQLDLYVAMSQVFWFVIIFIIFYLLITKNILPVLARSIKLRKKKVSNVGITNLDQEGEEVIKQTATTLETSLKDSQVLLNNLSSSSSEWLTKSINDANESTLLNLNKNYIKVIGELKGRSYLIEEVIKQK
jgi:F0F1-type ATP synthase membrane subunit b/b'